MSGGSANRLACGSMPEQRCVRENWNRKVGRWRTSERESRLCVASSSRKNTKSQQPDPPPAMLRPTSRLSKLSVNVHFSAGLVVG